MEDVFVAKSFRGSEIGSKLVKHLIKEAKRQGCYKIVGTSRHSRDKVHSLYQKLGFKNHGLEFRMDLK